MKVNSVKHCPPNCKFHYKTIVQLPVRHGRSGSLSSANQRKKANHQPRSSVVSKPAGISAPRLTNHHLSSKDSRREATTSDLKSGGETKPCTTQTHRKVTPFASLTEEKSNVQKNQAFETVLKTRPEVQLNRVQHSMGDLEKVIEEMKRTATLFRPGEASFHRASKPLRVGQMPLHQQVRKTQNAQVQCDLIGERASLAPLSQHRLRQSRQSSVRNNEENTGGWVTGGIKHSQLNYRMQLSNKIYESIRKTQLEKHELFTSGKKSRIY